jgi:predicted peptidase
MSTLIHGQTTTGSFSAVITETVAYDYLITFPDGYSATGPAVPLLLFLHGSGERGDDLELVKTWGPPRIIEAGERSFPAVVVSPQCQAGEVWNARGLAALVDDLCARHNIDRRRIYVTGLSMGGAGTWELAAAIPDRLAAIVPVCGDATTLIAEKIRGIPIWVFHGALDQDVPLADSAMLVERLYELGADVRFTVYADGDHLAGWQRAYASDALWQWLFAQRR